MTRRVTVAILVLAARGAVTQPQPAAPLTLDRLERIALEKHPALAQAAAQVPAAQGRVDQAGLLPNPLVGYTGEEIRGGSVTRGGEHGVFIERTIPLGGKLRIARRVAEHEVAEADAAARAARARA